MIGMRLDSIIARDVVLLYHRAGQIEMKSFFQVLIALLVCLASALVAVAQESPSTDERIVTPEEVEDALRSPARTPIRMISYPFRAVTGGMEKGLIKVETDHLRERLRLWTDRLRNLGVTGLFGGLGEQTGFGGGGTYTVGRSGPQRLTFLA